MGVGIFFKQKIEFLVWFVLFVCVIFIIPANAFDTDWPMFRHNPRNTGCSSSEVPDMGLLWSFRPEGYNMRSSPVAANGKVFIGLSKLYAVDEETGELIWDHSIVSGIHSCAAIDNSKVFVASADGNLYALDEETGAEIWSYPIERWGQSSPTVSNGKVFIGSSNGNLYAVDEETGELAWSYQTGSGVFSSPAVSNGKVFFGSHDRNLYAVDEETGELLWSYEIGRAGRSSPAVSNGKVFIGSYEEETIYALSEETGELVWSYEMEHLGSSSPAIANGKVFIGSLDDSLYALNEETGEVIWSYKTGWDISSSPAVAANGKVFASSHDQYLYALNENTGELIWGYKTSGYIDFSPAVANGRLFISSADGSLYAFGSTENHSPVLNFIGDRVIDEDRLLKFSISAADVDGDLPIYSAFSLPDGAIFDSESRTFSWTPNYTQSGEYSVTFKVKDGRGGEDFENVIIDVNDTLPIFDLVIYSEDIIFLSIDKYRVGVHNLWDSSIAEVKIAIYDGNPDGNPDSEKKMAEKVIPEIPEISEITGPGFAEVNFELEAAPKEDCLFVWVDPYNEIIGEVNKENNIASKCLYFSDWPMFRHDLQHTGYSFCDMPDDLGLWWSYQTGDKRGSPVAVSNDKVFVSSTNFEINNLYALNEETGELIWNCETENYLNLSSPAAANGKIFFGTTSGTCYHYYNYLSALDENTGAIIWNSEVGGIIKASPSIANGRVFVCASRYYYYRYYVHVNRICALDETTGELIWSYETNGNMYSSPAVSNGRVFVGSDDSSLYALDETTGEFIWSYQTGGAVKSSPAISNNKVFVGSNDGNLYALNETTGGLIWSYATAGAIGSSPAIANGKVFVGSNDGYLYALDETTGGLIWSYQGAGGSPAIADGKVFIRSANNFDVIDENTGELIFSYQMEGSIISSPVIAGGKVFVKSDNGKLHAFGLNNQPEFEPIGDKETDEGELLEFTIVAIDIDEDALTYSAYDLPEGAVFNAETHTFSWIPIYTQAGEHSAAFKVEDGKGKEDCEQINITVYDIPINLPDLAVKGADIEFYSGRCRIRLYNLGDKAAENVKVFLYNGDPEGNPYSEKKVTKKNIAIIAEGSSIEIEFDLRGIADGKHTIYLWVDPYNEIYEINEENDVCFSEVNYDWPMSGYDLRGTGYSPCGVPDKPEALWIYLTGHSSCTSPAVANGKIFIGFGYNLYAIDENTGVLIWSYATGNLIHSPPAVAGGKVFFGSDDYSLYALDENTGELIWSYATGSEIISSPAVAGGKVFFGSYDDNIYALDENTGVLIWSYQTGNDVYSSPTAANGKIFIGSYDGSLYALDENTGVLIWSYATGSSIYEFSPTITNDKVFIGCRDGKIYAIDEKTGAFIWGYQTGDWIHSSPAVAYGKVFIGSRSNSLYALDEETGSFIWSYDIGNDVCSSPTVADGKVFIGSGDSKLYALDEETGTEIWNHTIVGGMHGSSLAIANGKVFVGSYDGMLYAFGSFISSVQTTPHGTWVEINWQTNKPATAVIEYGTTIDYGYTLEDYNLNTQHKMELYNLEPATKYYFQIHAFIEGDKEYTYEGEFTTTTDDYDETGSCSGRITLQGRADHCCLITFELRNPGQVLPIKTYQLYCDSEGNYTLSNIPEGTYDLTAKSSNTLRVKNEVITVEGEAISNVDFTLLGGDANNDNSVASGDMVIVKHAWLSKAGDDNWDERADFNNDGSIGTGDLIILRTNWLKQGEE